MLDLMETESGSASFILHAPSIMTMEASTNGRVGNAFACERCRKHKVRCVPSETNGVCQRCQKARVECVEHIARRRPPKPRNDGLPANKKLEKLTAIVATMASSPPHSALPLAATLPFHKQAHSPQSPMVPLAQSASGSSLPTSPIFTAQASHPDHSLPFWESFNDILSGLARLDPVIRSISLPHMHMLLETYQGMVDFFPFVPLPKDCTFHALIQERPMLMFAAMTVASHDSVLLQLMLSREFRKIIMIKIMQGEKTLDLLQGLLIFIAWHHRCMDAQAVSVPMLLQMCMGMASELGLDSVSSPVRSLLQLHDSREREAERAYLGCHYLSINVGMLEPGKTRHVMNTTTLRKYATELASAREFHSDAVVPSLVDTCLFAEDVEETFGQQPAQTLVARTQVQRLSDKWETLRSTSQHLTIDFKTLQWLHLAARVHLYKKAVSLELTDREDTPWASGFQLSLRVTYLRSVEQSLDNSMKLASSQFELLSMTDWLHLVSTTASLSKLALQPCSIPGWDPAELQLTRSFDYFRDQLASHMPRQRDLQDGNEDCFERFRRITAAMKVAVRNTPHRDSPTGSTFELATDRARTVSLLQSLPLPRPSGMANSGKMLPSLWTNSNTLDMDDAEFHWRFLLGTV